MKKITFFTAIMVMVGCSVESADEFNTLDAKAKAQNDQPQFEIPSLTCGNNTDTSLEVTITAGQTTGAMGGFRVRWMTAEDYAANGWEDAEELQIDMCQEMFQVTGNNDDYALTPGYNFPFFLEEYIEGSGESCDRTLSCGMEYAFKVQAINESGKDGLKASEWSDVFFCSTAPCEEVECPAGYMIGSKDFNLIGNSNNWGWAHEFNFNGEDGSETREIHHKNGSLGGEVTISYSASQDMIEVTEGEGVNITHLYINDQEPETTNAPGQFDKTQNYKDADGKFWVMIKAEVCN